MKFIKVLANPGTSRACVKYINLEQITNIDLEYSFNCCGEQVYYIYFGDDHYMYVSKNDIQRIIRAIDEYIVK